jgi:ATP-dependent Lon protease
MMAEESVTAEKVAQLVKESEHGDVPEVLPILGLDNFVIFPFMIAPLIVTEERSKKLIDDALLGDRALGIFARRPAEGDQQGAEEQYYNVGTACIILKMIRIPDGTMRLLVHGTRRIRISEIVQEEPYRKARIEVLQEVGKSDKEVLAMMKNAQTMLQKIISLSPLPEDLGVAAMNVSDPGKLADLIASNLLLKLPEQQEVLEMVDTKQRLQRVLVILTRELEVLELGSKIQSQVKTTIDKTQREYLLREQLKAIKKELGEEEGVSAELAELRKAIETTAMPDYAKQVAEKELRRLEAMQPASAEYTVSRTYLDWILALPWQKSTLDNIDIQQAQKILNEDHYDLDKVKERILEYLAVIKLKGELKGPILCFVGPPGVGKTSLGRSISRALGRTFYRMSLGGMRDEAEIRGHRRTYIGAMPGRIIKGIKDCGSNNPVMMLDEVDKLGIDFRGDPAAALLEVLDPEQNNTFTDHYMDMPFDLSKVMFITTANFLDPVPPALRDRMETIFLSGYTLREKLMIAKRYLIPKEMQQNGLGSGQIRFTDTALGKIIEDYTREAGLRNVQREIGNICRKVARAFASGKTAPVRVTEKNVAKYLGPPRFFSEVAQRMGEPGVAIGTAWTQAGGEMLFIETTATEGKGRLLLTGQLGDVMKESAQAALSYVHSQARKVKIPESSFSKQDIHIHVPAGAIPKDGPSAGITICTAIASLLTKRLVKDFISMTGEITLKGNVLPVGGIKEKVLAAHRAGIREMIIPARNKKDLEDIPEEVRKKIKFHLVNKMDQVLKLALR